MPFDKSGPLRWGICSVGNISHDFCCGVKVLPENEHELVAAVSRDEERTKAFASKFNIATVHATNESLASDPNVDIVYIGATTKVHATLSKVFIQAGKHVLVEFPATANTKELKELVALAKEKNVLFFPGWAFLYTDIWKKIPEIINNGDIGDVRMITLNVAVPKTEEDKAFMGPLLTFGSTGVALAQLLMKKKPNKISAAATLTDNGIDGNTSLTLTYDNKVMAQINSSSTCRYEHRILISGTKGNIETKGPVWIPVEMNVGGNKIQAEPLPKQKITTVYGPLFHYLFSEAKVVRELLLKDEKECTYFPLQQSIDIMEILDEARRQIGVVFETD